MTTVHVGCYACQMECVKSEAFSDVCLGVQYFMQQFSFIY